MKLRQVGLAVTLLLATAPGGLAQSDREEAQALREAAVGWFNANLRAGQTATIVRDMTKIVEGDLRENRNFAMVFGSGLTLSGKAWIVQSCAGQFFSFTLTDGQARALAIQPLVVRHTSGSFRRDRRAPRQPVRLESPAIGKAESLDGSKPVTGTVRYQATEALSFPLAVRMSYLVRETTVLSYHHMDGLKAGKGTIRFSFDPVNSPRDRGKAYHGPLPVFLDLVVLSGRPPEVRTTLLSNTVGRLVEVG